MPEIGLILVSFLDESGQIFYIIYKKYIDHYDNQYQNKKQRLLHTFQQNFPQLRVNSNLTAITLKTNKLETAFLNSIIYF